MRKFLSFILCISLLLTLCGCNIQKKAELTVDFIDVGQGDAELLELPGDRYMLIDSGPSESEEEFFDFLESENVTKLDFVVATHPHSDHIGNMAEVVEKYDIGEFYMSEDSTDTKTYKNLLDEIEEKDLSINSAEEGVSIVDEPDLKIYIVSPDADGYDDLNDDSAVVKVEYKDTSFIFMGDVGKEVEMSITADVSADVIKIAHHGSSTSTAEDFIKKVDPKIAVICVGDDNSYNHPAQQTLDLLNKYNITYYRTDIDGDVIINSDGINVWEENIFS